MKHHVLDKNLSAEIIKPVRKTFSFSALCVNFVDKENENLMEALDNNMKLLIVFQVGLLNFPLLFCNVYKTLIF